MAEDLSAAALAVDMTMAGWVAAGLVVVGLSVHGFGSGRLVMTGLVAFIGFWV